MLKWEILCPCCGEPVSKADIDFADKRICEECRRKEKEEMWNKNNNHNVGWRKE